MIRAKQTTAKELDEALVSLQNEVELKHLLLYEPTHELRETYTFKINGGGELGVKESGQVTITFKDGKFEGAKFPFSGSYTRNGWRILADIEAKICDIENLNRSVARVP